MRQLQFICGGSIFFTVSGLFTAGTQMPLHGLALFMGIGAALGLATHYATIVTYD